MISVDLGELKPYYAGYPAAEFIPFLLDMLQPDRTFQINRLSKYGNRNFCNT